MATPIGNNPGVSIPQIPTAAQPAANTGATTAQLPTDGFEAGGQAANNAVNQILSSLGLEVGNSAIVSQLSGSQLSQLSAIGASMNGSSTSELQGQFAEFLQNGPTIHYQDVNALVQQVLREAYTQNTEDLRMYAEKVKDFNKQKEMIRDHLSDMRKELTSAREGAISSGVTGDDAMATHALSGDVVAYDPATAAEGSDAHAKMMMGMSSSLSAGGVDTIGKLEDEIQTWEDKLNSVGDDAQLANVDLQNMLQKQQQTLQMMSNISKALHDTAMAIIRKMGG